MYQLDDLDRELARIGDGAVVAPFLQHLAVFSDLVLPFLGGNQIVRVDVLKPYENPPYACLRRLFDEIWNLVTERADLDGKAEFGELGIAQADQTVEQ